MPAELASAPMVRQLPQMNLPWVESPFFSNLLETSGLDAKSRELVEHYAKFGYVIIDPGLGDVEAVTKRVIAELEPKYQGARRIQDAWKYNSTVKQIATSSAVLSLLRTLYRRDPIPFQTLNFPCGTEQATHSDSIHFSSMPERFMCGVWVALEDIDGDNGPLHYYPTSHKLPLFDYNELGIGDGRLPAGPAWRATFLGSPGPIRRSWTPRALRSMSRWVRHKLAKRYARATGDSVYADGVGSAELYKKYEDAVAALMLEGGFERHEVSLKKGQALVWAANLFHGGSPIRNKARSRHSQVTHYYFSDCMYYTPLMSARHLGQYYMRNITNIGTGEVVRQFYNGVEIDTEGFNE
jgi:hypothetical protein